MNNQELTNIRSTPSWPVTGSKLNHDNISAGDQISRHLNNRFIYQPSILLFINNPSNHTPSSIKIHLMIKSYIFKIYPQKFNLFRFPNKVVFPITYLFIIVLYIRESLVWFHKLCLEYLCNNTIYRTLKLLYINLTPQK